MKQFIKVNDNEIIGTNIPIHYIGIAPDERLQIQYSTGGYFYFTKDQGSEKLWSYFSDPKRCEDLTVPDVLNEPELFSYEELKAALKTNYPYASIVEVNEYFLVTYTKERFKWLTEFYDSEKIIFEYDTDLIKILK